MDCHHARKGQIWARAPAGVALLLLLAACPARTVTPVAVTQPGDETLTCQQIAAQLQEARAAGARYAQADRQVEQRNTAAGVASVFIGWPMLLTMDLSREEQIQLRALADRSERLENLGRTRRCS